MPLPAAIASGLPADPARFANAWEVFQYACECLTKARRFLVLAELVGDDEIYQSVAEDVRFLEKAAAAAEANWRKTGPSQ